MEALFGLLVMLVAVYHGVETSCDARQDGAQCYGALGGTVEIRLMNSTTGIHRFLWKKNILRILMGADVNILSNEFKNRSNFTFNSGTFRISNLNRNDTGTYELELINSSGIIIEKRTQILSIQAPVSSVQLDSECLSQGGRRASCSSDGGDSPHYSWTLDGHTLKDSQLLYGNQTSNNIILSQNVSGQLVCSVSNHVSNVSKGERISTCVFINCTLVNGTEISQWLPEEMKSLCFEPTTPQSTTVEHLPILGGVLAVLIIGLLVGVVCICTQKNKQTKNPKDDEDDHELTYADVRIVPNRGRQMQPRREMEVEYGEVKVSGRPRQTFETPNDDCVCAKVRKGR
ncbi:hemicentin-2-like isoform X2 [Sphaeramia orbicularis]|uniref:hemicentin-2-like isoform X2 n=1 Tax=Sphaeramia orbicularis TaxID=375764 RepID=UPI00117DD464|nr:hemicentin-2-like isoform X2 [Sphaeramia orbicularis]